jgi:hypothetical protein
MRVLYLYPAFNLLECISHPLFSLSRMGLKRQRSNGDNECSIYSPVVVGEANTGAVSTEETEDNSDESGSGGVVSKELTFAQMVSKEVVEAEDEEKDLVEYQLEDGR